MTPSARRLAGMTMALLLAAIAQGVYADAMHLRNAKPDFLTATAVLCALFCDVNGGAAVGFFAGLLHASMAGPPHGGFGSLIVSLTLICMLIGWLDERLFRDNFLIAIVLVALGTPLAEGLFFVFAPQPHISHWARALGLTTLYNSVLALPLYFLIRRLIGEHRRVRAY